MKTYLNKKFSEALISDGPASEYSEKLMLYGQFVGNWEAETTEYPENGTKKHSKWDIRFAWILEGRAIQDLWITPVRNSHLVGWHEPGNRYSTTIRTYDPKIDAWHILWLNPPSGTILKQIARRVGDEIIQIGDIDQFGHLNRWVYRDISPNSFRWCNEKSKDQGMTWKLVQEMLVRRTNNKI